MKLSDETKKLLREQIRELCLRATRLRHDMSAYNLMKKELTEVNEKIKCYEADLNDANDKSAIEGN